MQCNVFILGLGIGSLYPFLACLSWLQLRQRLRQSSVSDSKGNGMDLEADSILRNLRNMLHEETKAGGDQTLRSIWGQLAVMNRAV